VNLWDEITNHINKSIDDLKISLAEGHAENYNEYSLAVGKIAGLNMAKDSLQHIVKHRIHEDED
jgi:hypothetical protein|tara:strand:- start:5187 stop:5378 length:192 start_codon:yes stop_codon:yes gene_type:complete